MPVFTKNFLIHLSVPIRDNSGLHHWLRARVMLGSEIGDCVFEQVGIPLLDPLLGKATYAFEGIRTPKIKKGAREKTSKTKTQ